MEFIKTTKGKVILASVGAAIIAIVVIIFLITGAKSGYRSISVAELSGTVTATNSGSSYSAYKNMKLFDGYTLETDSESYSRLVLDEEKYIKLEENSLAVFEELGKLGNNTTSIRLERGAITNELTKPLGDEDRYVVNTPNAVLAVRGTFFRVEVTYNENGEAFTDVYTYGGTVVCRRVMPDGTIVDEEVEIPAGYKARVKMDEIITIYVEELIEENVDDIDPLDKEEIGDNDIVDIYVASYGGHKMFISTEELWLEIDNRGINVDEYKSHYNQGNIPHYGEHHGEKPVTSTQNRPNTPTESRPDNNSPAETLPALGGEPVSSDTTTSVSDTTVSDNDTTEVVNDTTVSVSDTTTSVSDTIVSVSDTTVVTSTSPYINAPVTTLTTVLEITETTVSSEVAESVTTETEGATTTTESEITEAQETTEETTTATSRVTVSSTAPVTHPIGTPSFTTTIAVTTTTAAETSLTTPTTFVGPQTSATEATTTTTAETTATTTTIAAETTTTTTAAETTTTTTTAAETSLTTPTTFVGPQTSATEATTTTTAETTTTTTTIAETTTTTTAETTATTTTIAAETTTTTTAAETTTTTTTAAETSLTTPTTFVGPQTSATEATTTTTAETTTTTTTIAETTTTTTTAADEPVVDKTGVEINETNFPDDTFRAYVSSNFDSDCDGFLSDEEVAAVTGITVSGTSSSDGGVTSLTGIEYFTKLTTLKCLNNSGLTGLDISKNTALEILYCDKTKISKLDVSNNTALETLHCNCTSISELDVSSNTNLKYLWCADTPISSLDVSNNQSLLFLRCGKTNLPYIDVTNNTSLSSFDVRDSKYPIPSNSVTFKVSSIAGMDKDKISNVSGADYDSTTGTFSNITGNISYTYDCGNSKSETFTLALTDESIRVEINSTNFPDDTFRSYVYAQFDRNGDWLLTEDELNRVTSIDVSGKSSADGGVTSLKGVEYFTKLTMLDCVYNKDLTGLDVSKNTALTELYCGVTSITKLDVSTNTVLTDLDCSYTSISTLDVSKNTALVYLCCENTLISKLDLSKNTNLKSLYCYETELTKLDLSGLSKFYDLDPSETIKYLTVSNTALDSLSLDLPELLTLTCSNNKSLLTLEVQCPKLTTLYCTDNTELTDFSSYDTPLTTLSISGNDALEEISVSKSSLTSLDVSGNTELKYLYCYDNSSLASIDVSGNTELLELYCQRAALTLLDVSKNTKLEKLKCIELKLTYLDLTANTKLTDLDVDECITEISSSATKYSISGISGIDKSKITVEEGADYNSSTGVFNNFTDEYFVYNYDCGNGLTASFVVSLTK